MVQVFLIGLSAGAAAALLSVSVFTFSPLAMVLGCLVPLPILIAALGWSHWTAPIAAIVAAAILAAQIHPALSVSFLITVGLPVWWLGYLALLARPVEGVPGGLEWYPVGHLVVWCALLGALLMMLVLALIHIDQAETREKLRKLVESALEMAERMAPNTKMPPSMEPGRVVDVMLAIFPPLGAVFIAASNTLNLWLASRIVRISGRLKRPPADLSAMRFPIYAPALIGGAVAASFFLPGLIGDFGVVLTASMLLAYAILGLAVMHAITRGMNSRPFALGGLYAAVIVFQWPMLLLSMLGLADTAFDLRGRAARRKNPPPNNPTQI